MTKHPDKLAEEEQEGLRLVKLSHDNPFRLFSVEEIRLILGIGQKRMTALRKLAQKEPETDPWDGDFTRPEIFQAWYWEDRPRIEGRPPIPEHSERKIAWGRRFAATFWRQTGD